MKLLTHSILLLLMPMAAPSLAQVSVEPAGMQIVWKSLKKEFNGFKTYNSSEGVNLTIAVTATDKTFIGFSKNDSKVSFKDGEKDLGGEFGFRDKISKDGKVMKLDMSSKDLPSKEATSIKVTGSLDVVLASKTKTEALGPREFKKGDDLEFGDGFKCSIDSIGKPKWGKDPLEVVFKWKRKKMGKIPELKAVRFYSEDGKLIESKRGSSMRSGFGGSYTTTIGYNLKKEAKVFKIEMELWTDFESVTVPIDMALGVGGKVKSE